MFERMRNFNGYNMFFSLEEENILDKIDINNGIISKKDLTPVETNECKNMVTRGLLNRIKDNNCIYYMINKDYTHE